ncbi:MAG TPA: hypothetical protein VGQ76_24420, partial [Thermoanaerobaculia bacterium]|nr:hypothetical protein [Thermoanaerobaculia bacterium]
MSERRKDATAIAIFAAVPALLFFDILFGINAFFTRDVFHYYFPAKKILREIVLGGHFPYWNPWFGAGQPLAANPEHEVFYPLTWLILLPDYIHALQLLPLIHVFIASVAMYALLRSMELSRPAAVLGALPFGIGGLAISMMSLFPCLFSYAWIPLTCLFTRRYLLHRRLRDLALAAFFLGIQLLVGEPTTAFQTGVILGMYAIYRGVQDQRTVPGIARRVGIIGVISILALCVAAVQVIPTIDHFGQTSRARGIDFENVSQWSTPFLRLGELVYPNLLGHNPAQDHSRYWAAALYGETRVPFYFSIYSGLLLTVLAFAGLLARTRGAGLALTIAGTAIIAAAGVHTPLLRWLYDAGVLRTIRYPEKFVLMLVIAIIVFGAHALDRLLAGDARIRKFALVVAIAISAIAAAIAVFSLTSAYEPAFRSIWSIRPTRVIDEMLPLSRQGWLIATGRCLLLLLLLASLKHLRRSLWFTLAGLFLLVDLGTLAAEVAPRVPIEFYREAPAVERKFPQERDDFRIFHIASWAGMSNSAAFYRRPDPNRYWVLRNALPPLTPVAHRLRVVLSGDFDLTELVATDEFTKAAWKLEKNRSSNWLNVVAAMSNIRYIGIYQRPEKALADAHGILRNIQPVKFVEGAHHPRYYFASEMEIASNVDEFVRKLNAKRYSLQVAFVGSDAFAPARGTVRKVDEWTNGARIDVDAAGRAFLVMSVTPHKYWSITIDGQPATAIVTNIGYQGVVVPAGRHVVEMRYRNPLIAIGGALSIVTLLALLLLSSRAW